jgi:NitT/TauT family transport system substrate-binding protein
VPRTLPTATTATERKAAFHQWRHLMIDTGLKSQISRRGILRAGTALAASAAVFSPAIVRAQVPTLRYSTGGAIAPNEIETLCFTDYFKKNVLKRIGKEYNLEVTYSRSTPEAAALMAAGQVDMACCAFPIFATSVLKEAVPGGMTVVADIFSDGYEGFASNCYFVLEDSPIKTIKDLRGKKIAVNAFGAAVDLVLRAALKKHGLDPKKDVQVVEVGFPNMGPALREKRVDCAAMVLPFIAIEENKGGVRTLFYAREAFEKFSTVNMAARNEYLKTNGAAVKAWLADYVDSLHWLYVPENRAQAIEVMVEATKSPRALVDSYFLTKRDYYRDKRACISAKNLQAPVDFMVQEGFLAQRIDMSKYVSSAYLPYPCNT